MIDGSILGSLLSHRPQHALHDLAPVHLLKRLVPFRDRPDAADDGFDIELPAREQRDDPLPDRPVVAEANMPIFMAI